MSFPVKKNKERGSDGHDKRGREVREANDGKKTEQ